MQHCYKLVTLLVRAITFIAAVLGDGTVPVCLLATVSVHQSLSETVLLGWCCWLFGCGACAKRISCWLFVCHGKAATVAATKHRVGNLPIMIIDGGGGGLWGSCTAQWFVAAYAAQHSSLLR